MHSKMIGFVRFAKLAAGVLAIVSVIYCIAGYVRSTGHDGGISRAAGPTRDDYGEKGEPGSSRGESGAGARR